MKNLLFIILLLPFYSFSQGSLAALDAKNGYKQIKLGEALTDVGMSQLTLLDISTGDGTRFYDYNNTNAVHISDNVTLDGIMVEAYKERVSGISLLFKKTDGDELTKIFTEAYGVPKHKDISADKYEWNGSDVQLIVDYSGKNGSVTYFSKKMSLSMYQEQNNATKKAAADL